MTQSGTKLEKPFRVLHTADWHLGKTLSDRNRLEEHRLFLDWLLQQVKKKSVDLILLAGDVFDSANPPQSAQWMYFNFISRLYRQGGCRLAIISGNHDSAQQLESPANVLSALDVSIVGFLPEDPKDRILYIPDRDSPKLAIAMIPFLRDRDLRIGNSGENIDKIKQNLAAGIRNSYHETSEVFISQGIDCPLLATGHLTVLGSKTSESERLIHIGGLGDVGTDVFSDFFSYIALGHIHKPQMAGAHEWIRYSGSPIQLSFSEAGDIKEVRILDFDSKGLIENQPLVIPRFRELKQIKCSYSEIESTLLASKFNNLQLRPWVELMVQDGSLETDIQEQVSKLQEKLDFDVIKVVRATTYKTLSSAFGGEIENYSKLEEVLSDPKSVFDQLLSQTDELDSDSKESLQIAFSSLTEEIE